MSNNLSNFTPEVWTQELSAVLDNNGVMMKCVNRNWEGDIKKSGDTVHIRTFGNIAVNTYTGTISYTDLTSPMQDLVIDQQKYFAFLVDDISKAQANINIMDGYLQRAKIAIDLCKDSFLLSKYTDVPTANIINNGGSPVVLDPSTIFGYFSSVTKALRKSNALSKGQRPWIVINPDIEAVLVQSELLTHATNLGDEVVKEGSIGRVAGLDVMVSTNLTSTSGTTYALAGTNDAITFASQVVEVESLRLQDSFNTAVRGLYLYGAKTVLPYALSRLEFAL